MRKPVILNELEKLGNLIQFLESLIQDLEKENVILRHQLKEVKFQQANLIILDPRIEIKM
jgi:hypothetical protein